MKNKFLVIISFVITFILVFIGVGCSTSAPAKVSIDEYIKNKKIAFVKNLEDRRKDDYKLTTIKNTMLFEGTTQTEETYDKDGETVSVTYIANETRHQYDVVITYEVKDGVVKFNQSLKLTSNTIKRSLNENKEIVEIKNEEIRDEFYTLEYVDDELRMYMFDNVNPEKNFYTVQSESTMNETITNCMDTVYQIMEKSTTSCDGSRLYKDGSYVGIESIDFEESQIYDFGVKLICFKSAMDNNGNIKAEKTQYEVNDIMGDNITKICFEIKYGGAFESRDIVNIPQGQLAY